MLARKRKASKVAVQQEMANARAQTLEQLGSLRPLRGKHRTVKKPKGPRKTVTDAVMIEVLLDQAHVICPCGCGTRILTMKGTVREHTWALENRPRNPDGTVKPDANDPKYIRLWLAGHDKQKTFGPGGTKRITTKGSDNQQREQREALSKSESAFQERMAAKGKPIVPRRV